MRQDYLIPQSLAYPVNSMNPKSIVPSKTPWLTTFLGDYLYSFSYLNPKKDIPFEGTYKKKVFIIVNLNSEAKIKESDEVLLFKILKSINLVSDDIFLLKIAPDYEFNMERLLKIFNPAFLFIFGPENGFLEIPISLKTYELTNLGLTKLLLADSLPVLSSDPDKILKNKLWGQLKLLNFSNSQ